jgi:hypothetical protein
MICGACFLLENMIARVVAAGRNWDFVYLNVHACFEIQFQGSYGND